MAVLPPKLLLTGSDYFIHAIDHRMRRGGAPGNICRLILDLNARLDTGALRRVFEQSGAIKWISGVRMRRILPILAPTWRSTKMKATPVTEGAASDESPLDGLNGCGVQAIRADIAPGLAFDVLHHAAGSRLILTWHHSLMDVRGAELLLRYIQDFNENDSRLKRWKIFDDAQIPSGLLRIIRAFPRRASFARQSLAFISKTSQPPLFSLVNGSRGQSAEWNYRIIRFDEPETKRIDMTGLRLNATFRRSLFYLAASIKALHAAASRSSRANDAYLIPVPHDLRRHGAIGPIFSNQVSFLFFRVEPLKNFLLIDTQASRGNRQHGAKPTLPS